MIKIFQNTLDIKKIENNSIIFSSSNNLLKLKEMYINTDVLITTLDNYIKSLVNKNIVDDNKSFIYMYLAFNNVKYKLVKYKDIDDIIFINLLLSTYDFYKENNVLINDKVNDLKVIFNEYESLLKENDFITKYDM